MIENLRGKSGIRFLQALKKVFLGAATMKNNLFLENILFGLLWIISAFLKDVLLENTIALIQNSPRMKAWPYSLVIFY